MIREILRISLGSDERSPLTDFLERDLRRRGFQVDLHGPIADEQVAWPDVADAVARRVADGRAAQGVLCCWTGTGVSIAANKVPGVRAALCADAETALGARAWNDANVLCLSLRATSEHDAKQILDAWFSANDDESGAANIDRLREIDERYRARAEVKGGVSDRR